MTLIKSISGIRGTIGGKAGENLTPLDTVKFTCAYGSWLKKNFPDCKPLVVLGRDTRVSGKMIKNLVSASLQALAIDVLNLDLSTTPTVEMAVILEKAQGGIIITASHNPAHWNALKMLNSDGEFISEKVGKEILDIAEQEESFSFATIEALGGQTFIKNGYIARHIDEILQLSLVDEAAIKKARLKIVVDAVNSTGGLAVPELLERLGVEVVKMYCELNGLFPHNPEPLREHLSEICQKVPDLKADMGIVVDPDVDRLVFVCENGELFGEEYTLVAVADYVLSKRSGSVVSSLSSSRALRDIASRWNVPCYYAAVGEVNVVKFMKETDAVIGGEGNGGIIYPDLHYGRDALVGIALFLTHLAYSRKSVSALRKQYPPYFMAKKKIKYTSQVDLSAVFEALSEKYQRWKPDATDGLKIDFTDEWVHLRKSNTESIIRVYAEAISDKRADVLSEQFLEEIRNFILHQQC
ncbi:phosphoglucosamine mutase [Bacteroidetes bacterium endosymbiont of Geopemphigus sp.]|uniref:phosphoglucosamine mutase n=1 Tax=Bacteroidetes bacterium endosymbiont of Geopemphigus sp. TaxID=2047937 RepID=UPI000CD212D4|nr:phosphoglucosamine mutase [Bacteroidetes bacterium endosymbiont of Geopemphigus sp.]